MIRDDQTFVLRTRDRSAAAPVLSSVAVRGQLDGVLFSLVLRQTYRNRSDRVLEVVYTFPLPARAMLLGFASELNGERKDGRIVGSAIAEHRYEAALEQGDAPVMLESLHNGLYSANIGNLAPGDELVLEVKFTELLRFEQNRLRLSIPTTIAPRYGNPAVAGLQPQQVPQASLEPDYPLALSVDLGAALRGATVDCPTHRFRCETTTAGTRFELKPGARLDRDVIIVATLTEQSPGLLVEAFDTRSEAAPCVLMASFQAGPKSGRDPIALKIAIDCSGSMAGDSIASARAALRGVVAGLEPGDWVGVSRFGTRVEHLLVPAPCTQRKLHQATQWIDGLEADMGGTEMHGAMRSVFLQPTEGFEGSPDVLLITDGQIWEPQHLVPSAQAGGHRIFIVGVGSSVAESGLRELADATGGACEFVSPGEDLEAAARRMIDRMHRRSWRRLAVDWGGVPLWQSALPVSVAAGDAVIAFAGLAARPAAQSVRLMALDGEESTVEIARTEAGVPAHGDDLARVAAWQRLHATTLTREERTALAIEYSLLDNTTKCILVHARADADKTMAQAQFHRVTSMLAAGWGGTSSVPQRAEDHFAFSLASPDHCFPMAMREAMPEMPSHSDTPDLPSPGLLDIAEQVAEALSPGADTHLLARVCSRTLVPAAIRAALDEAIGSLGVTATDAWLVLAAWINEQVPDPCRDKRAETLNAALLLLDAQVVEAVRALFDRDLVHLVAGGGASSSRRSRLARAITGS